MTSLAVLIAAAALNALATLLDLRSSLACSNVAGLRETSVLYASRDGKFRARGVVLMLLVALALTGAQAWLYALANPVQYGAAALTAGVAFWHVKGWRGNVALLSLSAKPKAGK